MTSFSYVDLIRLKGLCELLCNSGKKNIDYSKTNKYNMTITVQYATLILRILLFCGWHHDHTLYLCLFSYRFATIINTFQTQTPVFFINNIIQKMKINKYIYISIYFMFNIYYCILYIYFVNNSTSQNVCMLLINTSKCIQFNFSNHKVKRWKSWVYWV